jgi:hypothetical protein
MLAASDKHFIAVDGLAFDGLEADGDRQVVALYSLFMRPGTARPEAVQALKSLRQGRGGGYGFEWLTLAFTHPQNPTRIQRGRRRSGFAARCCIAASTVGFVPGRVTQAGAKLMV